MHEHIKDWLIFRHSILPAGPARSALLTAMNEYWEERL